MPEPPSKKQPESDRSDLQEIDLSEAIQLIRQAGYPDPRETFPSDQPAKIMQQVINCLCALSMHDGLTGLYNRRYFQIALKRELLRSKRDNTPCSLLMIDIDHFKEVNDHFGHPAGDKTLKFITPLLKNSLRPGDTFCRYGGEEFTVILPNCALIYAIQVAERLRGAVEQSRVPVMPDKALPITVSIGAAETRPLLHFTPATLIKAADEALYTAKSKGRNQTCSQKWEPTEVSIKERSALFNRKNQKNKPRDPWPDEPRSPE